ncbi:MAG: DNA-directed RNA polymerase omega subunit, partial [uncultured Solirubrobacterales bacterium]
DQAPPRHHRRREPRRLAVRRRRHRGQARAADQFVLPEPGRGGLRGARPADGRDDVQELPEDRPRRGRRRQAALQLRRSL